MLLQLLFSSASIVDTSSKAESRAGIGIKMEWLPDAEVVVVSAGIRPNPIMRKMSF